LRIPHIQGVSSSLACCVLQGFALEVVSEWCQEPALESGGARAPCRFEPDLRYS
jgi:hypothetical protein